MRITAITTAMVLGAVAMQGQSWMGETNRNVTVCVEGDAKLTALRSEVSVSQIFAGIGLAVIWHNTARDCSKGDIRIDLRRDEPVSLKPGVLAYARPYEGTDVQVFYKRICAGREPKMVSVILTHVLAHEIAHILEGINRHSRFGIMKANWDDQDYFRMRFKPLEFAPEDIELINCGLASRSRSPMLLASARQPH